MGIEVLEMTAGHPDQGAVVAGPLRGGKVGLALADRDDLVRGPVHQDGPHPGRQQGYRIGGQVAVRNLGRGAAEQRIDAPAAEAQP